MITVVGSINLDLIATVGRLPCPGETVHSCDFKSAPGGKGANQALAAARAGASVRMVGAVGKDAFAGEALAYLKEGGVDLSGIAHIQAATGIALIMVGGDSENMIAVVPGANGSVVPEDLVKAQFKKGDIVLLQHEIPLATVDAAIEAGRKAGAVTMLNTAPFRAEAASFVGKSDYVVANETEFDLYAEALSLSVGKQPARISEFARRTGATIIVTLGSDGVLAAKGDDLVHVSALKIAPVDTVGAGDTFCGYLAAGVAAGLGLEEALKRAATAGSLACLKQGSQPAIPLAAEVDAVL